MMTGQHALKYKCLILGVQHFQVVCNTYDVNQRRVITSKPSSWSQSVAGLIPHAEAHSGMPQSSGLPAILQLLRTPNWRGCAGNREQMGFLTGSWVVLHLVNWLSLMFLQP
eukprot:TRINITY_DN1139_c0_g1_i4.p3 TRINITY_DN1139_c0_g1~~TRINITY_DN1139_c0_g1_i4.p3  ORF type:complete len:111 (+),score=7.83 TRINITY_DN1139_c0_g1_i4:150-482(+)